MKENVLDVLLYLFQNFMDGDLEIDPDRDFLIDRLVEAGFQNYEIDKAFVWLDDLATNQENQQNTLKGNTFRLFTDGELGKLDVESRGFLLYLENMGVLTTETRELVIERVMALDSYEMDIERVKWVILMVLFNQPEQDMNFEWIENMVFDSSLEHLH
ncbi:MAG TPA: DUF494 domain-containing protein [Gammaproteobacteria bacterium]|nr:DUF494 domain-containing protein [Gammaproteobacteria bacterium]